MVSSSASCSPIPDRRYVVSDLERLNHRGSRDLLFVVVLERIARRLDASRSGAGYRGARMGSSRYPGRGLICIALIACGARGPVPLRSAEGAKVDGRREGPWVFV